MSNALRVPVAVVPIWILVVAEVVAAGGFLTFTDAAWAATARLFGRAAVAQSLAWADWALLLSAGSPATAALWARFCLPTAFLAALALWEVALHLAGGNFGAPGRWLWPIGLAGLLGAGFLPSGWLPMHRVPDGFWLPNPVGWLPRAIAWLLPALGLAVIWLTLIWGARRRATPRFRFYLLVVVASLPLAANDTVWVQSHRTWYPTLWITGLAVLAILWWELYRLLRRAHSHLATDALTSARSRRYGVWYGSQTLRQQAVGVVFGDLDGFKRINDHYGHVAGDAVLREVVRRLQAACRGGDQVVRLGGDEFLIILPGARESDGSQVVRRLEAIVREPPVAIPGTTPPAQERLAMSFGWAWGEPGSGFWRLVSQADRAMYLAKARRRNPPGAPEPQPE